MQEPRRARAAADLVEPTQRIVAQAGARAAAAADQAVLDIVDVAVGAIRGQSLSPRRRGLPLASYMKLAPATALYWLRPLAV